MEYNMGSRDLGLVTVFFFPSQTPLASRAIVCSLREQFVFFLAPLELPLIFPRTTHRRPIIDLRACTLQQVSVTRISPSGINRVLVPLS